MRMLKSLGAVRWILASKKYPRVVELLDTIEVLPIYTLHIGKIYLNSG
jgi:hypothetical protein